MTKKTYVWKICMNDECGKKIKRAWKNSRGIFCYQCYCKFVHMHIR